MATRVAVEKFLAELAPLRLAEPWDNVGWLIDRGSSQFSRIFLTIDLTPATLDEALASSHELIVAYHPPLFGGVKRLRASEPSEAMLLRLIEAGLSVYAPHTALDAVEGGMAEWLAGALGAGEMRPIAPAEPDAGSGAGRLITLERPCELEALCARVKVHLGLEHLRISRAEGGVSLVHTAAVCPGAGGSLFEKVGKVDLLLTGEMRHHDILARRWRGTHVIVTDHTNTERGYLEFLATRMRQALPDVTVTVSTKDADPLAII